MSATARDYVTSIIAAAAKLQNATDDQLARDGVLDDLRKLDDELDSLADYATEA